MTSAEEKDKLTESIASCGYTVVKKLGQGFQGTVFSIIPTSHPKEGLKAFKNITPSPKNRPEGITNLSEIDILCRLRHPNLMYAEDLVVSGSPLGCKIPVIGLILPLATYTLTDLETNDKGIISPETRLEIVYLILRAVEFLHRNGITHEDLHSDNIVFQGDINHLHPLISDFGAARFLDGSNNQYEILGDIYYLGFIMRDFLGPSWVYPDHRKPGTYQGLAGPLVTSMIQETFERRPGWNKIFKDPIFAKVHKEESKEVGYEILVFPVGESVWVKSSPERIAQVLPALVDNFPEARVATLFLALDLILRSLEMFSDETRFSSLHLATCLWMAIKLQEELRAVDIPQAIELIPEIKISIEEITPSEAQIVKFLQGRLYRRWLYHAAGGLEDLLIFYKLLLQSEVDLNLDPQSILKDQSTKESTSKYVTVKEFLRILSPS